MVDFKGWCWAREPGLTETRASPASAYAASWRPGLSSSARARAVASSSDSWLWGSLQVPFGLHTNRLRPSPATYNRGPWQLWPWLSRSGPQGPRLRVRLGAELTGPGPPIRGCNARYNLATASAPNGNLNLLNVMPVCGLSTVAHCHVTWTVTVATVEPAADVTDSCPSQDSDDRVLLGLSRPGPPTAALLPQCHRDPPTLQSTSASTVLVPESLAQLRTPGPAEGQLRLCPDCQWAQPVDFPNPEC